MRILRGDLIRENVAAKPELMHALMVADQLHQRYYGREAEFTWLLGGTHKVGSLHYVGLAADLRTWYMRNPLQFSKDLGALLGDRYDVVLEKDHIHLEFQPKTALKESP